MRLTGSQSVKLVRYCDKTVVRFVSYVPRKKNYYEILGIDQTATLDEIKHAFAEETRKLHPDLKMPMTSSTNNTERLMHLKEAYDGLRKPEKRREYDRELEFTKKASREMFYETHDDECEMINLNVRGPGGFRGARPVIKASRFGHFFDPSKEMEREKKNERIWIFLGGSVLALILGNVIVVSFLNSKRLKVVDRPVVTK
uniref:J domain-containing protein n=2 Tax=Panagrolaimus sp. JU765 TaxID=591449 RepID=A0AC34RB27_9BILA